LGHFPGFIHYSDIASLDHGHDNQAEGPYCERHERAPWPSG
jgi:hypothetical protein